MNQAADFIPLNRALDLPAGEAVQSWRLKVPAKGACYLLEDEAGRPLLLATTANLRQTLVHKLSPADPGAEAAGLSKRIDYAAVVRRVRWRDVFSRFEANFTYLENARALLGDGYRKLIRHWRASWVSVDLADPHPRFVSTDRPPAGGAAAGACCFGPFPDGRAARRQIELLEDLFDLCREHQILVQAPHGSPCAYKQMGRCPAPCDGSITMEAYRQRIEEACRSLTEPREASIERLTGQMKAAAAEMKFEVAGRIKRQIDSIRCAAETAADRLIAPLAEFRFLSIQRGSRKGAVRLFAILPGVIEPLGEFGPKDLAAQLEPVLPPIQRFAAADAAGSFGTAESERIALAGWSLLSNPQRRGVFVRLNEVRDVSDLTHAAERLGGETGEQLSEADAVGEKTEEAGQVAEL